jgi:hypothetical protein
MPFQKDVNDPVDIILESYGQKKTWFRAGKYDFIKHTALSRVFFDQARVEFQFHLVDVPRRRLRTLRQELTSGASHSSLRRPLAGGELVVDKPVAACSSEAAPPVLVLQVVGVSNAHRNSPVRDTITHDHGCIFIKVISRKYKNLTAHR